MPKTVQHTTTKSPQDRKSLNIIPQKSKLTGSVENIKT